MISKALSLSLACATGWLFSPPPTFGANLNTCDETSLRTSLAQGGRVQFACDGTIPIHTSLEITQAVELDATGRNVILDALGASRIFHVQAGGSLTLRGLKLTGGSETNGGAIFIQGGELKLYQCRIANNRASGWNGGFSSGTTTYLNGQPGSGGALHNQGGRVAAVDCQFQGNTAQGGTGDIIPTSGGAEGGIGQGGALASLGGWVALTNCVFSDNVATGGLGGPSPALSQQPGSGGQAFGGALHVEGGELVLQGCEVSNNASRGGAAGGGASRFGVSGSAAYGGGISLQSTSSAHVQSTRVFDNQALGGAASLAPFPVSNGSGLGGGIHVGGGILEMSDSEIRRNSGGELSFGSRGEGGGVYNASTNFLVRCHIASNFAPTSGGGLANIGNLLVHESLLLDNRAGSHGTSPGLGGGAYLQSGSAEFVNCTLTGNTTFQTSGEAGAALHNGADCLVRFCTIAENGGPSNVMVYASNPVRLLGSLIAQHSAGTNLGGAIQDLGHNISSDASVLLPGPGSLTSTDPLLHPLADNGGPTWTMGIGLDSPALNNGGSEAVPAVDQRGRARPQLQIADSGAYELILDYFKIIHVAPLPEAQLEIRGIGPELHSFELEASSDLGTWTTIQSGQVSAGGIWALRVTRGDGPQFFRLRAP